LIEAAQVGRRCTAISPPEEEHLFAGAEVKLINFSLAGWPTTKKVWPGVPEFVDPEQQRRQAGRSISVEPVQLGAWVLLLALTARPVKQVDGADGTSQP